MNGFPGLCEAPNIFPSMWVTVKNSLVLKRPGCSGKAFQKTFMTVGIQKCAYPVSSLLEVDFGITYLLTLQKPTNVA